MQRIVDPTDPTYHMVKMHVLSCKTNVLVSRNATFFYSCSHPPVKPKQTEASGDTAVGNSAGGGAGSQCLQSNF